MAQEIEVPGMGIVEFPDDMSDAAIAEVLKAQLSPTRQAVQVGLPSQEEARSAHETFISEAPKVLASGVYGGVTAIPRMVMEAGNWLEQAMPTPEWSKLPIPGGSEIASLDTAIREAVRPETSGGQMAARILESGVAGLTGPGALTAPRTAFGVGTAAGLGAEGAAAAFGDSALTRTLGGLTGGLAGGLASAAKTNRGALAREALDGVQENDLLEALYRMEAARNAGVPINLSQAMPRASNIDAYVEALATSRHGKNVIDQLREQPAQIARAGQRAVRRLPGEVLPNRILSNEVQEGADAAIRAGMKEARAAWQRHAPLDAVFPESVIARFDQELAQRAARFGPTTSEHQIYQDVRKALRAPKAQAAPAGPQLLGPNGQPLTPPPAPGPKYLSEALMVKGAVDDALENFGARRLNTPGLQAKDLREAAQIRKIFRGIVEREVPELAAANRAFAQVMEDTVNPMKKSITGDLAGRLGAQADVNAPQGKIFALFDRGTAYVPGQAKRSEILTLERDLRKAGKEGVFLDAGKTWIADRFAKAIGSGEASSRAPEEIAGNLLKLFGDPRSLKARTPSVQAQGLDDVLAGMARAQGAPDAAYVKGFKNFMQIVTDAARRPRPARGVSPGEIKEGASEGLTRWLGRFSIMFPIRQPALRWARFLEQDSLSTMDKLLTSPEGVATLVKLGKQPPYSHSAVSTIATFFGTVAGASGEGNSPGITDQ